jgi:hypothetical protein
MAGRDGVEFEGLRLQTGGGSLAGGVGLLVGVFLLGALVGAMARGGGLDLSTCLNACKTDGLAVFSGDRCECNPPAPASR